MKSTLTLAALTALFGLNIATAGADEYADGFFAAEQHDYDAAMQKWQPLAQRGHAEATFNMALIYHSGAAGRIDETRALEFYRKAAEQGHPTAQEYLAAAYAEGWFGLKKDQKQARYWEQQRAQ